MTFPVELVLETLRLECSHAMSCPSMSRVKPFELPLGYRNVEILVPSSETDKDVILLLGMSEKSNLSFFHTGPSTNPNPVAMCSTWESFKSISLKDSSIISNSFINSFTF